VDAACTIIEAEEAVEEVQASTTTGVRVSIHKTKILPKDTTTWVNSHNMAITTQQTNNHKGLVKAWVESDRQVDSQCKLKWEKVVLNHQCQHCLSQRVSICNNLLTTREKS